MQYWVSVLAAKHNCAILKREKCYNGLFVNIRTCVFFPDEMKKRREFYKEEIESGKCVSLIPAFRLYVLEFVLIMCYIIVR